VEAPPPCSSPLLEALVVLEQLEPKEEGDHYDDNDALFSVPKTPKYSFNPCFACYDLEPGENHVRK